MTSDDHHSNSSCQIEALWITYGGDLERRLARRTGRPMGDPDLQDAVAAAFERTYRYLQSGRTIGDDPTGWLITVAWHEYLRARERRSRTDHLGEDQGAALPSQADDVDDIVADQVHREDLDRILEKALARLTPRQRVVVLTFESGYTYREIQALLGISHTAVNKALVGARAKLRADDALRKAYRRWTE
jgi:RNA polymerase sigma factor (sigma-70 family)